MTGPIAFVNQITTIRGGVFTLPQMSSDDGTDIFWVHEDYC